jgi:hypothetical protein
MDLDLVQAQWMLDLFPADQIPEFAAQAMMQGFDGPNILGLVSLHRPTRYDIRPEVFEGAVREMGRAPLSFRQAKLRVAQDIALRILRSQVNPEDGASEIQTLAFRGRLGGTPEALFELGARMDWMDGQAWPNRERELAIIEWAWDFVNGYPGP